MDDTSIKRGVPRKINGKWDEPDQLHTLGVLYWKYLQAERDMSFLPRDRRMRRSFLHTAQQRTGLTLVEPRFLT